MGKPDAKLREKLIRQRLQAQAEKKKSVNTEPMQKTLAEKVGLMMWDYDRAQLVKAHLPRFKELVEARLIEISHMPRPDVYSREAERLRACLRKLEG